MRRWLHEPLVHFLALGLALFAISRVVDVDRGGAQRLSRIELTPDDIRQVEVVWQAQWQRPPTPEELRGLLEARVREEVMYREALALGLDRGDTIVKRRLAQKMEFLGEDLSALPEPTTTVLRAWFEKNAQRYALPGRVSFRHLYFASDRRGAPARQAADVALAQVTRAGSDATGAGLGDRFMYQDYYADRDPDQVAGVFGSAFAKSLFALDARPSWQGPVESGFGWHVVRVESRTPGRVPTFDEVEAMVRTDWVSDQRDESRRKAFEVMRARYTVVLPPAGSTPVVAQTGAPIGAR
jgi:peptidyl-prolyl cis-trans isomerase C